jgi:DNA-binding response OmpR family regulator
VNLIKDIKTLIGINEPNSTPDLTSPPYIPPTSKHQKKVLIVEDDKSLADVLEIALKEAEFNVIRADNGQAGLELLKSQIPDLVILDLMMPVMDGKTMLAKLREIPDFKYLPVIVLTNAGDTENMKETITYNNAEAFLVKANVTTQEIIERVKESI